MSLLSVHLPTRIWPLQIQAEFRAGASEVIAQAAAAAALPTAIPEEPIPEVLRSVGRRELELTFLGTGA